MRTWAKVSTPAALLAVAVMSFGGGAASADTDGDDSIGGGNQVNLPISLPIDISGNAVGVAGDSTASSAGGASVVNNGRSGGGSNRTSGDRSILGGNQVVAPINAPVNACGNAVSLFGNSDAGCKGGASVQNRGGGSGAGGNRTSGDRSILGGNQVVAPINAPVNACGNAVAIFGEATAGCRGGASVRNSGSGSGAGGNRTSGRSSVLGGNQVVAPITAPVNICGNAVAALGDAFAGCKGGASVTNEGGRQRRGYHRGSTGNDTDGRFGVGSGNQVVAPINLPITACGNSVGNATAGCQGGASVHTKGGGSGAGGNRTSGRNSVLGGNQVVAPITAPVNVCGNAVAVLGDAFAGCKGGASVKNGGKGAGGNRTSGRNSVLGGNQVVAPITAPVNVCGNAVAVLGDAAAGCLGGAHVGKSKPGYRHGKHLSGKAVGAVPGLPGASGVQGLGSSARQMSGGGLPIVGDVAGVAGLLGLPQVPGLPGLPSAPAQPAKPVKPAKKTTAGVANPATDLVAATPVGGAVRSVAGSLPVGGLGLMSAAQPAGVTGMSAASLLALALGGLFAVTATVFAAVRRFRPAAK
ncbi:chaplin family protein [Nonomuraea sp. MCN248]|uniref:Chaplin family protein n=1 Tax=Nonomuraea corallina TaxID=2989783 RepID=A0ABT4SIG6_9ACTN|nr:chaplin family protein [Nonomuraea corallina]MDA0637007.1 chaplin family protein [Nonomuraea corallina]